MYQNMCNFTFRSNLRDWARSSKLNTDWLRAALGRLRMISRLLFSFCTNSGLFWVSFLWTYKKKKHNNKIKHITIFMYCWLAVGTLLVQILLQLNRLQTLKEILSYFPKELGKTAILQPRNTGFAPYVLCIQSKYLYCLSTFLPTKNPNLVK